MRQGFRYGKSQIKKYLNKSSSYNSYASVRLTPNTHETHLEHEKQFTHREVLTR